MLSYKSRRRSPCVSTRRVTWFLLCVLITTCSCEESIPKSNNERNTAVSSGATLFSASETGSAESSNANSSSSSKNLRASSTPEASASNSSSSKTETNATSAATTESSSEESSSSSSSTETETSQRHYRPFRPYRIWSSKQYDNFVQEQRAFGDDDTYSSSGWDSSQATSMGANDDASNLSLNSNVNTMIVSGSSAYIENYPYMTYIYFNYNGAGSRCGGTLIAPDMVLTAAHCLPATQQDSSGNMVPVTNGNDLSSESRAMLGATNRYDKTAAGVENFGIEKYFHPGFYRVGDAPPFNDLAILKLDGCSTFPRVQLNSNFNVDDIEGEDVRLIGWGEEGYNGGGNGGVDLMQTDQDIDTTCSYWSQYMNDELLCAARSGTGPCFGDSGGPLLLRGSASDGSQDVQIGIVSFGWECADVSAVPSIYTRVAAHLSWIDSTISQYSQCSSSSNVYSSAMYSPQSSSSSTGTTPTTYSQQGYGSGSTAGQTTSSSSGPLSLQYLNDGGTLSEGAMFSVQANVALTITSFSLHLHDTTTYYGIDIYQKSGSPSGFETTASAWTKTGSATNVQGMGHGVLSPLPSGTFSPITMSAGETLSFYIESTTDGQQMVSQSGGGIGVAYASNTDLSILQHSANTNDFYYSWTPYKWNGAVIYTTS